ncbi:LysR substrate-binding domain-containing protein [Glacieibacterium sp.]|uniref:LysR substrate-binding domain-containing protein n=1 Tax=Glacieibacterium sp. TaxID=2860237 RepID=UPI003AFF8DCD
MQLRRFRYFVTVADELHFGRAAERLGISQPPLSQQIMRLEQELGVELFERTSRRVQLTDVGRVFLVEARRCIEQADHAVATAQRAQRGEIGDLAIGFASSTPFTPIVAKALFEFRASFPAVHLELEEMSRSEQIAGLVDHSLDIGFIRGANPPILPSPLVTTVILEEQLLVAMRDDHPLADGRKPLRIADLAGEGFVLYDPNSGAGFNEHFARLCREAGFEPRIVQEVSGLATLLGLVAAGFGLTVLSRSLAALSLGNLVHRPLDDAGAVSRLWLTHRTDMSPACRSFAAIVVEASGGSARPASRGRGHGRPSPS